MINDILNESFCIEVDEKKYTIEFDHLAYATLEKETDKSIYFFFDELALGKNLMYTDLLSFVKTGMIKHHSSQEIDSVIGFLKAHNYQIQAIKNNLLMAFFMPLIVPSIVEKVKKKVPQKKKNKKSKI